MTIAVVFEFPNDSIDKYYQVFELGGAAITDQPARLHHECFDNGDGWTVVDLWESEQAFARFGDVLGPALQQLGLATVPKVSRARRVISRTGEITDY